MKRFRFHPAPVPEQELLGFERARYVEGPPLTRPMPDLGVMADGTPIAELYLPERILCAPFWFDFAWLVAAGVKTLETRGQPWRGPPGWLVVYVTKGRGGKGMRPVLPAGVSLPPDDAMPKQVLTCLLWIAGSRPLLPEDTAAACFYEAGRHAWIITRRLVFATPVPLAESGLTAPPQSPVRIARDVVVRALLAQPRKTT